MRPLLVSLLIIIPSVCVSLLVVFKMGDALGMWARIGPERTTRAKRILVVMAVVAPAIGVAVGFLIDTSPRG